MAQRQFRSDDTNSWLHGFGSGVNGAVNLTSGTTTWRSTYVYGLDTFSGTAGSYSGTLGIATNRISGWQVGPCLIHQSQNTTGSGLAAGNWELNYILSVSSPTVTFLYPLTNTYIGSGAQILQVQQHTTFEVGASAILDLTGGSNIWRTGDLTDTHNGIAFILASQSVTIAGEIQGNIVASRTAIGYLSDSANQGKWGEGTTGAAGSSSDTNGGGQSGATANPNVSGGGGGNGTAGTAGTGTSGGSAQGNAGLTLAVFGGGGGAGTGISSAGGTGGGLLVIIAPTITVSGTIHVGGANGGTATSSGGGGGGGAGGSILFKGQIITLGSGLVTAAGGSGGAGNSGGPSGGAGGSGRIHADYSSTISGSTTPTLDSRSDTSIKPPGSGMLQIV